MQMPERPPMIDHPQGPLDTDQFVGDNPVRMLGQLRDQELEPFLLLFQDLPCQGHEDGAERFRGVL